MRRKVSSAARAWLVACCAPPPARHERRPPPASRPSQNQISGAFSPRKLPKTAAMLIMSSSSQPIINTMFSKGSSWGPLLPSSMIIASPHKRTSKQYLMRHITLNQTNMKRCSSCKWCTNVVSTRVCGNPPCKKPLASINEQRMTRAMNVVPDVRSRAAGPLRSLARQHIDLDDTGDGDQNSPGVLLSDEQQESEGRSSSSSIPNRHIGLGVRDHHHDNLILGFGDPAVPESGGNQWRHRCGRNRRKILSTKVHRLVSNI